MNKNIKVIGSYKCGCTYGPVKIKNRLECCPIHGMDIQNEYEVFPVKQDKDDKNIPINANSK